MNAPRNQIGSLLDAVKVDTDPNTGFITITASASSGTRAADIANAFAQAINSERARQAVAQIDTTVSNMQAQLNALPPAASIARHQLAVQLTRLRAQRAAQDTNTQVIEPATAPLDPVSPRPLRNGALGLVVGILLGLGLVALIESVDRRIRRVEDLEEMSGLPVLTSLPRSAFDGNIAAPIVAERFRGLRANLSFFNIDRDIQSIVVASGRQGEGKSLVSIGLARAYTAAGSNVILVDADLRRPVVGSRLGTPESAGLADVLVGKATVAEALVQHRTANLRVLSAGELPPNPSELLASERMQHLVGELSAMCDLLIFDTSPLLAVSDALPLLDQVSGTLLVTRIGVSRRDELQHLRKIVDSARSASLGLVATGASERGVYPYEYATYIKPYGGTEDEQLLSEVESGEDVVSRNGDVSKPSRGLTVLGRLRR
jgi:capsular exopolysaccharide synthesis family protein